MRLAIIGGGSIGQRHADNARTLGHDVVVYDLDLTRGIVLDRFEACDAAMICTPAATHALVARTLCDLNYAGPLFVEKPICMSMVEADIFRNWLHPVTMVGYNWRFHPDLIALEAYVRKPYTTLIVRCDTNIDEWPGKNYADPLLECSHEIDWVCAELGIPTSVDGGALNHSDGVWIQMRHPRGDSLIEIRWRAHPERRLRLKSNNTHLTLFPSLGSGLNESYLAELAHFLRAVQWQVQPSLIQTAACSFTQGLRVVDICEVVMRFANVKTESKAV